MTIATLHRFDWDHLRFFLAVADHGTLAGAARALAVNHSTVFRRIGAFENELGVRLFDRLPDGYALTAAGEEILGHARAVDEAVAALNRSAAGRDYQLSGEIRLTTAQILADEFVCPALKKFSKRHPGIRVAVAVSDSDYDLTRREADLALRATPSPPEHLVGRHVASLPWFVYGAARGRMPDSIAELGGYPLIGADATLERLPAFRWLHGEFPREKFVATANSLNTMAAMARSGLGLAVLPADQTGAGLRRLFPVTPEAMTELWLLTHPDLRHVARNKAFADFLFDWLQADRRIRPFVA